MLYRNMSLWSTWNESRANEEPNFIFYPSFFLFLEEQNFNLALLEFRRRQLHVASPGTGRRGRCLPLRCGAPGPADGARAPGRRIRAGVGGAGGRRPETIEKAGIHTLAAALPRSQEIMK